jgi:phenylpyruvate tautomerase PptA (4-oxalocrotonate tautomerase family)
MPAVICEVGPATVVVEQAAALARAIVDSLTEWAGTAWD